MSDGKCCLLDSALGYHSSARKVQRSERELTHHAVMALHKERLSEIKRGDKRERKEDGG